MYLKKKIFSGLLVCGALISLLFMISTILSSNSVLQVSVHEAQREDFSLVSPSLLYLDSQKLRNEKMHELSSTASSDYHELMRDRRNRLYRVCKSLNLEDSKKKNYGFSWGQIFYFKRTSLLYCPVFKAGSSTWLDYIFHNSREASSERKAELLEKFPRNLLGALHGFSTPIKNAADYKTILGGLSRSFLIVRHPFHRLVSAYRDKLERLHSKTLKEDFYYQTRGKKMVQKYRKQSLAKFGREFFSAANNFGTPLPVNGVRLVELPTFWEFVQSVKSSTISGMDEHWRPVTNYCRPCSINYETIVHFENLSTEGQYLKRYLNASVELKEGGISALNANSAGGRSDEELTKIYFGQLSPEDIESLYKVYHLDFELFGYTYQVDENNALKSLR